MQIMTRDLEIAIESSKKANQNSVNLLKVLERLSISPRDLYYESEATFILDNLGLYVNKDEEMAIIEILNNHEELEVTIIDEIVELTTNYDSPANNEDFIADALCIIRHFTNTVSRTRHLESKES